MIQLSILLQAGGASGLQQFVPIILIMVVFYFFMIRPQTKKAKIEKDFKAGLKKGDKVVTIGGVHGKITEVQDSTFTLEIDSNVKVKIEKSAISAEASKQYSETTPEVKK